MRLTHFAWLNALLHLVGLMFAWLMREGTMLNTLPGRMAWLAQDPFIWNLGWICWMLAALCVGGLFAGLWGALGKPPRLLWAVALACAGAAADIFSELIYISVLPPLARAANRETFLAFEAAAFSGGCVLANGFYTLGLWLCALELRAQQRANLALDAAAAVTVCCGAAMSVAGLLMNAELLQIFTGPTILGFCAWGVLAARRVAP
ncbi:MAG: hypothetical protein HPKKFMNG_01766 [Planctomycetes bacterium]|nr:hypothetical protein [Planctomycetota bacterium]HRJ79006.1 hypothetical protein [Planctomycetota bacterium]